jgi:hypothetical protein
MSKYDQKSEKPAAILLRSEPRLHVVHLVHTPNSELAPKRALYGLVRASTAHYGHVWKKTPLAPLHVSPPLPPRSPLCNAYYRLIPVITAYYHLFTKKPVGRRYRDATRMVARSCTNLHLLAPTCGKKNCANPSGWGQPGCAPTPGTNFLATTRPELPPSRNRLNKRF